MKIAAYLRISTDAQAERGQGLDVQRQAIRAWAHRGGHRVVSWHSDEGISGSNGLDTRDGLPDAIRAIRDHQAEGLAVYRLDRLARDLILQETLLREIAALGGRVFSTFPGEQEVIENDPDDPGRRLIRQVLGAVSEYERSLIRLRLRNGRRRKAERGGFAYGSPRYGWRAEGKQLVPEPAEQAALARIVDESMTLEPAGTWQAFLRGLDGVKPNANLNPLYHASGSCRCVSCVVAGSGGQPVDLVEVTRAALAEGRVRDASDRLTGIRGVGPKNAPFFLRDVAVKFEIEPARDRELLQPIDVWVRRYVTRVGRVSYPGQAVAAWICRNSAAPEAANQGLWYFGSQIAASEVKFRRALANEALANEQYASELVERYVDQLQGAVAAWRSHS